MFGLRQEAQAGATGRPGRTKGRGGGKGRRTRPDPTGPGELPAPQRPQGISVTAGPSRIRSRFARAYAHPIITMLTEPARDLMQSSAASKVVIVLSGGIAWIYSSAFESALVVAMGLSLWDWASGRAVAKRRGVFDADVARVGMHVKISTYVQLGVIRIMEAWAALHVASAVDWIPDSRGWLATGLLVGFMVSELDSIDRHKIALGGEPLWGWSRVSAWIRRGVDRSLPGGTITEEELREQEARRRGVWPGEGEQRRGRPGPMNGTHN